MAQRWTIKRERIGRRDGFTVTVRAHGVEAEAWRTDVVRAIAAAGDLAAERIESGEPGRVVSRAGANPFAGGRSIVTGQRAQLLADCADYRAQIEDFRRAIDADTGADGTPGETVRGSEWAIEALERALCDAGRALQRLDREGR